MPNPVNDDLFESSTMSFGEHLEELRGALFRSIIGLTIGFLIATFVANRVVQWMCRTSPSPRPPRTTPTR
jgi:sec-independent protein translocase protein TatC